MQLIAYGLLALAVMAAVATGVYKVKQWGANEVRLEWAEADRKATEEAVKEAAERQMWGNHTVIALQQASKEARDYETKWREARRASQGVPLAACPPTITPPVDNAATATVDGREPDSGLRLTPAFVLLYDAAWTGQDGEPIWPYSAGTSQGAAGPDPARPEEVLDTHAENAWRCSENARQLGKLIGLLKKLRGE